MCVLGVLETEKATSSKYTNWWSLTLHVHVLNLFSSLFVEIRTWNGHWHHFVAILRPVGFDKCDVNKDPEDSSNMRTNDRYPEPVVIVPATNKEERKDESSHCFKQYR